MMTNINWQDTVWTAMICFLGAYVVMMLPEMALAFGGGGSAGDPEALEEVLCNVVGWFQGTTGKAIATLAIIVVGLGALMGKVSWGMAIIVGIGVAVVFGADTIVDALSSENDKSCPGN
jgi:type IV secretion system protein VirB2